MNRMIKIGAAAATLAGIALAGAGAATASATHSDRSTAQTATQADPPNGVWIDAFEATVPGWQNGVDIPDLRCPAQTPYLVDHDWSPGRAVPRGVQVLEPGGVGVTIPFKLVNGPIEQDKPAPWVIGTNRFAAGATNWGFSAAKLKIRLNCSASQLDGYRSRG